MAIFNQEFNLIHTCPNWTDTHERPVSRRTAPGSCSAHTSLGSRGGLATHRTDWCIFT